jgi:hypothetical protein
MASRAQKAADVDAAINNVIAHQPKPYTTKVPRPSPGTRMAVDLRQITAGLSVGPLVSAERSIQ